MDDWDVFWDELREEERQRGRPGKDMDYKRTLRKISELEEREAELLEQVRDTSVLDKGQEPSPEGELQELELQEVRNRIMKLKKKYEEDKPSTWLDDEF